MFKRKLTCADILLFKHAYNILESLAWWSEALWVKKIVHTCCGKWDGGSQDPEKRVGMSLFCRKRPELT